MKAYPTLKRWLLAAGTVAVFAVVLVVVLNRSGGSPTEDKDKPEADKTDQARSWPLFGGSVQRNLVNLVERNLPTSWDVTPGKQKNIKWVADLGSKAYGGPIIAGGKVFVGTNNEKPRNPKIMGDKGIVMCFREDNGDFLWQAVHDKLPAGQVHDWPREGICSSPVVEGD